MVLRNKLSLQNQDDLDEAELALFLIRADEEFPYRGLDYPRYMALHTICFRTSMNGQVSRNRWRTQSWISFRPPSKHTW